MRIPIFSLTTEKRALTSMMMPSFRIQLSMLPHDKAVALDTLVGLLDKEILSFDVLEIVLLLP